MTQLIYGIKIEQCRQFRAFLPFFPFLEETSNFRNLKYLELIMACLTIQEKIAKLQLNAFYCHAKNGKLNGNIHDLHDMNFYSIGIKHEHSSFCFDYL